MGVHEFSLALQLVGTVLAAAAALAEWRAARTDAEAPPEQLGRPAVLAENPWDQGEISGPMVYMSSTLNTPHVLEQAARQQLRDAITMEELRIGAANEWDRQQQLNKELLDSYRQVLTEQREAEGIERAATRRRVVIELAGLALVALGTSLPDLWPWLT